MRTIATGKYQEWTEKEGLLQIEGWAREGLTDEQIAQKIGIAAGTLYRWQNEHQEIREALKKGKAPVDIQVENALLKRALGYEYEEVTTEIIEQPDGSKRKHVKKTTRQVIPDTAAAFIWLKNRRPDRWRDKPPELIAVPEDLSVDDALTAALKEEAARIEAGNAAQ